MDYKIYIVHYTKNTDRRAYLEDKLKGFDNVIWMEKFQSNDELYNILFSITPKEMLVWQAHHWILGTECDHNEYNNSRFVILEDDVIFPDNFDIDEFFTKTLDEFHKSDAEMIYMGTIPGLSVSNPEENKRVYTNVKQCSVCTHAYSIKTTNFKSIAPCMETNLPIDHEMNRLIDKHKIKVAWSYPALEQGTITNQYRSNLR